ncbi:Scd5p SCDLUD_000469 [Saccharomycodes ludwigii]|uniref:Scd5p n=1 Tax=Saccharomycodes ludwigii TaxID=36035 RepID=UPI001E8AFFF6|nr:hypothetical protein SCDLUD_000469 [Saccharomycodes ludwigii]KAH3902874.1 hypothetical protein SCDLUD_000469 [Saccharomycodes ludwigii]
MSYNWMASSSNGQIPLDNHYTQQNYVQNGHNQNPPVLPPHNSSPRMHSNSSPVKPNYDALRALLNNPSPVPSPTGNNEVRSSSGDNTNRNYNPFRTSDIHNINSNTVTNASALNNNKGFVQDFSSKISTTTSNSMTNMVLSPRKANHSGNQETDPNRLSLTPYQLSLNEAKTYLRWYNNILIRKHSNIIRLVDIFKFLQINFPISESVKQAIEALFHFCKDNLKIGQFYAVLRLISHALMEKISPSVNLLGLEAPALRPKSILNKNKVQELYEEVADDPGSDQKFDFDNFASLLLTGKSHRVRRVVVDSDGKQVSAKKVRFSEKLETFQEEPGMSQEAPTFNYDINLVGSNGANGKTDLSLPMDQLLKKINANTQPESQEEKEVLADMKDSLKHFQNLPKIDSVTLGIPNQFIPNGTSTNNYQQLNSGILQPLKPTATGSANHLFEQEHKPIITNDLSGGSVLQPLKPTATGSANHLFSQHEQQQGTVLQPLHPTATGSANHLFEQQQSTLLQQPLKPTATGSANHLFSQQQPASFQQPLKQANTGNIDNLFTPQHLQPTFVGSNNDKTDNIFNQQQSHPIKPVETGSTNYLQEHGKHNENKLQYDSLKPTPTGPGNYYMMHPNNFPQSNNNINTNNTAYMPKLSPQVTTNNSNASNNLLTLNYHSTVTSSNGDNNNNALHSISPTNTSLQVPQFQFTSPNIIVGSPNPSPIMVTNNHGKPPVPPRTNLSSNLSSYQTPSLVDNNGNVSNNNLASGYFQSLLTSNNNNGIHANVSNLALNPSTSSPPPLNLQMSFNNNGTDSPYMHDQLQPQPQQFMHVNNGTVNNGMLSSTTSSDNILGDIRTLQQEIDNIQQSLYRH